jgi:hypothetical protein
MKIPDGIEAVARAVPSSIPPEMFEDAPPSLPDDGPTALPAVLQRPAAKAPPLPRRGPMAPPTMAQRPAVNAPPLPRPPTERQPFGIMPPPVPKREAAMAAPSPDPTSGASTLEAKELGEVNRHEPSSLQAHITSTGDAGAARREIPVMTDRSFDRIEPVPGLATWRWKRAAAVTGGLLAVVVAFVVARRAMSKGAAPPPATAEGTSPATRIENPGPAVPEGIPPATRDTPSPTAKTDQDPPQAAGSTPSPAPALAGTGILRTSGSVGRRIFVDGRTVGQTPHAVSVQCGPHQVRIGSAGRSKTVDIPCGGEIIVGDR